MNRKRLLINAGRVLLLIALGLRIWAAWAWRSDIHHDRGRAALMALHMADGADYPVFAYGAPHLGSLEPALSAILFRLFGYHEFLLNLVTVLIAFPALLIVYRWTRETGGRLAGLVALTYMILGPYADFIFSVLPRGGYALTLTLSTTLFWLTGNLVRREAYPEQHAPVWMYHALGVLLGLSWWTNQLLVAVSGTALIWVLFAVRFRLLNRRMLSVVLLYFLTSSPWWIWNFFNQWESLAFLPALFPSSLKNIPWTTTIRRILTLTLLPSEWGWVAWTGPVIFCGVLTGSLVLFVHAIRTRRTFPGWIHLGLTLSFLPIFILCYAASPFSTNDSLRPLIVVGPLFALMLGCCSAWLFHRLKHRWLALIPAALLLIGDGQAFRQSFQAGDDPQRRHAAIQLADFCRSNDIQVVFVHRWQHWMNAATQEGVVFCDAQTEPYAPYEQHGNQADRVALLDDIFHLSDFLRASGSGCSITNFGPYALMTQFTNPPPPARPLPEDAYASILPDGAAANRVRELTDQDCDTSWDMHLDADGDTRHLVITLNSPTSISGIRLWCNNDRYPGICSVEGRNATNTEWHTLLEPVSSTPFYWSGPRWYINGLFYRMVYRWPASEPLTYIRLSFPPQADHGCDIDLAELQLLAPPAEDAENRADGDLAQLLLCLKERNIIRCFADRWLSAKIQDASGGHIETIMPSFMKRSVQSGEQTITNEYYDITRLSPKDAMLVHSTEAPNLARVLERHRLNMRQTVIGPWVLFDFAPGTCSRDSAFYPGLKWIGYGCLSNNRHNRTYKGHYDYLEALDSDDPDVRLDYLKEAVSLYPRHKAALKALADVSHLRGNTALNKATLNALDDFLPQLDAPIRFSNGITLLGVTPIQAEARPGGTIELAYYWECPPTVHPNDFAVFVHCISGSNRFQDDHVLLEDVDEQAVTGQLTPETFVTRRVISVPKGLQPGTYQIDMGLYNRKTSFRLHPATRLKTHNNATVFPFSILILPDGEAAP